MVRGVLPPLGPRSSRPNFCGSRHVTAAGRRGGEERMPGETQTGSFPERVPHPKEAAERTPDATQCSVNTALLMVYYHHRR